MIQSQTAAEFDEIYNLGCTLLANQRKKNGQLMSDFESFASNKTHYAEYCIAQLPGNRGRKGSATSESNHSSVLSYLNDGVKGTNRYEEHPMLLIRDLLSRQQKHVSLTNKRLFGMHQHMRIEQAKLKNQPNTFSVSDLMVAASWLNHEYYRRYKSQQARCGLYTRTQIVHPITAKVQLKIQSVRHPEAPPRVLDSEISSRCPCPYRLAELDMCVHEILAKGGFVKELHLEMHLERQFVSGSINGWVEPKEKILNDIIGYSPEIIRLNPPLPSEEEILEKDTNIPMFNPFSEGSADDPLPVDYLPERNVSTTPFTKKEIENVLHGVLSGYSNFRHSRRHDISLLVLQLDELLTLDEKTSNPFDGPQNSCLLVPTKNSQRREPKTRLQPVHERYGTKKMKYLQKQGITQILTLEQQELQIKGDQKRHCSFCNDEHGVNVCTKLKSMGEKGMTYHLTSQNLNIRSSLKDRLSMSMPVVVDSGKGSPFQSIDRKVKDSNFIIHLASLVQGKPSNHIEGLNFCITFLDKFARNVNGFSRIWISGDVMQCLINHSNTYFTFLFE